MLMACLDDQVGTQTTLARAVAYAANPSTEVAGADPATGADILVSSLGPNGADWDLTATLELAIEFAAANGRSGRGLAIFWAASNGNNVDVLQDEVVSHADVIAVVRSTRTDLEDNAARGPEVELIAPGVDVVSTTGARRLRHQHRHELRRALRGGLRRARAVGEPRPDPRRAAPDHARFRRQDRRRRLRRERAQRRLRLRSRECARGRRSSPPVRSRPRCIGNDIALVRQTPGWASIPVAFSQRRRHLEHHQRRRADFIPDWAHQPGVRVVAGDFNGNGLTDIALVRQTPGWASIPIAFANGDGTWNITNGPVRRVHPSWAHQPGVRVVAGDFNGNGLTDIALVRQTPGWASIPIAFANGDGTWNITNGGAPDFIPSWASSPGCGSSPATSTATASPTSRWCARRRAGRSIPIAFANGDGTWNITNGPARRLHRRLGQQPGVRVVTGDFNGNGLTDIALVRQTPGWASIPIAFANGDGTWNITNGGAPLTSSPDWAQQPGVRVVTGDFNGNGLTDIALVRQTPGWASIPIAFANGDGTWNITNGGAPHFIPDWAHQPGVQVVAGDFNRNGLTDIALVRQTPGWATIPVAFSNGDGTWNITNGGAPQTSSRPGPTPPGVRLVTGDFHG